MVMLPLVSVPVIALPLMLMLSTSRSPVMSVAPVIARVAVSIVTVVDASISTVGATISISVSASMSNCPSVLEAIDSAESVSYTHLTLPTIYSV